MDIQTTQSDGILTIEFNRPERKNAITGAMYTAMAEALRGAEQDSASARHPHHRQAGDLHRR
jgi:enoyl-CoA hydratase/carnithine racemase